jgi:hypothetical protein
MSSKRPPRSEEPSPLRSTKQMLDELDALMERMLALPVSELDELPPVPRDAPKTPTLSATLTVLEPTSDSTEPAQVADILDASSPSPSTALAESPREFPPSSDAVATDAADALGYPIQEPVSEDLLPPPLIISRPGGGARANLPNRLPWSRDRWLQPLIWVNGAFDFLVGRLGGFGRWLQTQAGRNVLGLAGLVCLALALFWLLRDWFNWTW